MTTRSHHARGVHTHSMGPRTLGPHEHYYRAVPPNVRCPTCGVLMRKHKRCLACRVLIGSGHEAATSDRLCEGCQAQRDSGEGGAAMVRVAIEENRQGA